jgi:Flp pilus assembly protein TadD
VAAQRTWGLVENLGAAHYRAGQFAKATATLEEAVKRHGQGGTNWMKVFLAMAYRQRGQNEQAHKWFDCARLLANADWQERLLFDRLGQEAAQLFKRAPRAKR